MKETNVKGNAVNYANREAQLQKINHFLVLGVLVFSVIISGIVFGSVLNKFRTPGYFGFLVFILAALNVINFIMYKRNPGGEKNRYVTLIGLSVVTFVITFAYNSDYMRFMALIPFIGCILFYDLKFSMQAAILLSVLNFGTNAVRVFITHATVGSDIINSWTSCLVVTVMMFIVWYTTFVGKKFNDDSLNKVKQEAENQKKMVDDVLQIAEEVRKGTENAMDLVNTLNSSAETIRHSVNDISDSTVLTAENIQTQTVMTQNIQANIERTVERSEHMVKVAHQSSELNESNMEKVAELKKQAEILASTNAQVAESMRQLQENVVNVKNITQTIFDISSQTNLLALNASIEAARAGDAGRGFSVVADEIRNLSEKTREETENISRILEELNVNANQTAEAVEKSVTVSDEQDKMIVSVAEQFTEMNNNVNELVGDISEIDNMLEGLSAANNQIVDNIMQLSATTEEVTAAAQQSTEITEQNLVNSVDAQTLLNGVLDVSHQMDKYID